MTKCSIPRYQPVKWLRLSRELTGQAATKPEFDVNDAL
jgi:hypothetical protein